MAEADLILHVVDGSDDEPEGQITAVREVLAEIGAHHVPEIIVINKADAADPETLARLQRREPHSIVVSAKTGAGIEQLLGMIEHDLPRSAVEIDLVVPYDRGDLLARAHKEGELERRPPRHRHAAGGSRERAARLRAAPLRAVTRHAR